MAQLTFAWWQAPLVVSPTISVRSSPCHVTFLSSSRPSASAKSTYSELLRNSSTDRRIPVGARVTPSCVRYTYTWFSIRATNTSDTTCASRLLPLAMVYWSLHPPQPHMEAPTAPSPLGHAQILRQKGREPETDHVCVRCRRGECSSAPHRPSWASKFRLQLYHIIVLQTVTNRRSNV
jgi:hypothetical protein